MKNEDMAKIALATGIVIVVFVTMPPMIVSLPICIGSGIYIRNLLSKKDDKEPD